MGKLISSLGLVLLVGVCGCDLMTHTHCEDKILSEMKSPDGKYVAVLAHRSCANGTGLYTGVIVRENSLVLGESVPVLTMRGIHDITGAWIEANHLEVSSEALKDEKSVLSKETSWKSVVISYK